jgi:hypothetical protein
MANQRDGAMTGPDDIALTAVVASCTCTRLVNVTARARRAVDRLISINIRGTGANDMEDIRPQAAGLAARLT